MMLFIKAQSIHFGLINGQRRKLKMVKNHAHTLHFGTGGVS